MLKILGQRKWEWVSGGILIRFDIKFNNLKYETSNTDGSSQNCNKMQMYITVREVAKIDD